MAEGKTVVVADRSPIVRRAFAESFPLESRSDLPQIVSIVPNEQGALAAIAEHQPSFALVGLGLPYATGGGSGRRGGLNVARQVGDSVPVVIMSTDDRVVDILQAFGAGAVGYIDKQSAFDQLDVIVGGLRDVSHNFYVMSSEIAARWRQIAEYEPEESEHKIWLRSFVDGFISDDRPGMVTRTMTDAGRQFVKESSDALAKSILDRTQGTDR